MRKQTQIKKKKKNSNGLSKHALNRDIESKKFL